MEGKTIDARTAAFVLGTYAAEQSGRDKRRASSEIAVVGNYGEKLDWVNGKGKGIDVIRVQRNGEMKFMSNINSKSRNPSYIISNERKDTIFVCDERYDRDGTIEVYRRESDADFKLVATTGSGGKGSCHMTLDSKENHLVCASYFGDGFSVYELNHNNISKDFTLVKHSILKTLNGSSAVVYPGKNKERQERCHPHMVTFDPQTWNTGKLRVVDLGMNAVCSYTYEDGKTTLHSAFILPQGAGPRHMVFHPRYHYAYVVNELDSTLTSCVVDASSGKMRSLRTVSTLPSGFQGKGDDSKSTCAALRIHPSGRWIYCSNRVVSDQGLLSHFKIDEMTGIATLESVTPTCGVTPRDFNFAFQGSLILIANQDSDNIASFHVNSKTGCLSFTGAKVTTATPVSLCVM